MIIQLIPSVRSFCEVHYFFFFTRPVLRSQLTWKSFWSRIQIFLKKRRRWLPYSLFCCTTWHESMKILTYIQFSYIDLFCLFQGLGWWYACRLTDVSVFAEFLMPWHGIPPRSPLRGHTLGCHRFIKHNVRCWTNVCNSIIQNISCKVARIYMQLQNACAPNLALIWRCSVHSWTYDCISTTNNHCRIR